MIVIEKQTALSAIENSHFTRVFNLYYGQKRALSPYIAWSSLFSIGLFVGLFIYNHLYFFDKKDRLKQVVDIELVSPTDFRNKEDILPATKPKPFLAKKTSPILESRGDLFAPPVFVVRTQGEEGQRKIQEKGEQKQVVEQKESSEDIAIQSKSFVDITKSANRYLPMNAPLGRISVKRKVGSSENKPNTDLNIEEVRPPEMVEIKENEGDTSNDVWQSGGHSSDGKGAPSSLSEYLKDLHRKLKQYWAPPSRTVHHIKVIFRLGKNGNLVAIKLISSSGDANADNSAMTAVKEASPFGRLPADYAADFLDLAYTFNYTTDELNEIKQREQDF